MTRLGPHRMARVVLHGGESVETIARPVFSGAIVGCWRLTFGGVVADGETLQAAGLALADALRRRDRLAEVADQLGHVTL